MDQFTQQNAAMVEQTSAGTRNLSLETETLVDQLLRFRLGGGGRMAMTSAVDTVPPVRQRDPVPASPARAPAPAPAFHGNAAVRLDDDDWSEF